jgi:hypothetical protein
VTPRRSVPFLVLSAILAGPAGAQDWPGFRGPNRDGQASGSGFGAKAGAMAARWRAELGSGYSGIAVSGARAVTMFSDGARDVLAAFDTATGREVQSIYMLDTDENALVPLVRTAQARPLRVYHDWGLYGHTSTREGYLRARGFEPAGGEAKDGAEWASWRNRTDRLLAVLLPPR